MALSLLSGSGAGEEFEIVGRITAASVVVEVGVGDGLAVVVSVEVVLGA